VHMFTITLYEPLSSPSVGGVFYSFVCREETSITYQGNGQTIKYRVSISQMFGFEHIHPIAESTASAQGKVHSVVSPSTVYENS